MEAAWTPRHLKILAGIVMYVLMASFVPSVLASPPPPNACGSQGASGINVPNLWYSTSCNAHDLCYGVVDRPKAECDGQFLADNLEDCDATSNLVERELCREIAPLYWVGVRLFGDEPYDNGQEQGRLSVVGTYSAEDLPGVELSVAYDEVLRRFFGTYEGGCLPPDAEGVRQAHAFQARMTGAFSSGVCILRGPTNAITDTLSCTPDTFVQAKISVLPSKLIISWPDSPSASSGLIAFER